MRFFLLARVDLLNLYVFHTCARECSRATMGRQLDGMREQRFDVRTMRFLIDLFENEAKPVVICSESFDAAIYEAIWCASPLC